MIGPLDIHRRERQRMSFKATEVALHQILVAVGLDCLGQREPVCHLVRRIHAPAQVLDRAGQSFRFHLAADRELALDSYRRRPIPIRTHLLLGQLFAHRHPQHSFHPQVPHSLGHPFLSPSSIREHPLAPPPPPPPPPPLL